MTQSCLFDFERTDLRAATAQDAPRSARCLRLERGRSPADDFNVRKIFGDLLNRRTVSQDRDNHREGFRPDFGEKGFSVSESLERQAFRRWIKYGIDAWLVATGIDSIPAVLLQVDGIESMQTEGRTLRADSQPLIAQSRWCRGRTQSTSWPRLLRTRTPERARPRPPRRVAAANRCIRSMRGTDS